MVMDEIRDAAIQNTMVKPEAEHLSCHSSQHSQWKEYHTGGQVEPITDWYTTPVP